VLAELDRQRDRRRNHDDRESDRERASNSHEVRSGMK
jgi:hypothetical protein